MKRTLIFIALITACGCSTPPVVVTPVPGAPVSSLPQTGITFNKLYGGGVATCDTLYSLIEGCYNGGKMTKAEASEMKGKVDKARSYLDQARILYVTNAPNTNNTLLAVLATIATLQQTMSFYKQRVVA
jgi:hypothetical protein